MARLQDYQHTATRVHGYHNNKGELVGWWECRIPGTALTCVNWSGSQQILPIHDRDSLIAEKSWGLTPVGVQVRKH